MTSRLELIMQKNNLPEGKARKIMEAQILSPLERQAFYLVKQIGYNPSVALEVMPGIFSVLATKKDERYNLRVNLHLNKVVSNDLLVQFWSLNPEINEYFIRDVKRFSRSTKE